jgi:hypothetical protein
MSRCNFSARLLAIVAIWAGMHAPVSAAWGVEARRGQPYSPWQLPEALGGARNQVAKVGVVLPPTRYSRADTRAAEPDNLVAVLDPALPLLQQTWKGLNCDGQYKGIARFIGDHRADASTGGRLQRFGKAVDPLDGRLSYVFRVVTGDPLTAGALRCEAVAPPTGATQLPRGSAFWYGFRMLVWEGQEARSGSALLTQWHIHGHNPFLGLYLKQGHLEFTARHDRGAAGTAQRLTTVQLWRDSMPVPKRWSTFVVFASVQSSGDSVVRIWRDGESIVDYTGPLGYDDLQPAYAKIGYYHWLNANPWDESVNQRTVYVSKAGLVRADALRQAEPQLRAWLSE